MTPEPRFFTMHPDVGGFDGHVRIDHVTLPPYHAHERCPLCSRWRPGRHLAGEATARVAKGRRWTDFVGAGSGRIVVLAHGCVVAQMRAAKLKGFEAYPVRLEGVKPTALNRLPDPEYHWLDVTGYAPLDLSASGGAGVECPECGLFDLPGYPSQPYPIPPDVSRWDGSDLFHAVRSSYGTIYCTRRVLDLAREGRWSHVLFRPADLPGTLKMGELTSWSIDYLGEHWPPRTWYPPGYAPDSTRAGPP